MYWWIRPRTPIFVRRPVAGLRDGLHLGYGDLIPSTRLARIFSVFVVLLGFGVLSFVTAAIAATFVESRRSGASSADPATCTGR